MGSTRLPGKVLMDIAGESMLARVIGRVRLATTIDRVIVVTTTNRLDDALAAAAAGLGVDVYRGSESDVLDRYYQAATQHGLDVVARVTADCPLLDPDVLDRVVRAVTDARPPVDFAANTLERTFPRGLDVEVATMSALSRVWTTATSASDREHVFPCIYRDQEAFSTISIQNDVDRSDLRWTVDTVEDLELVRRLFLELGGAPFGWTDVVAICDLRPELVGINADVLQKPLHELGRE